MCGILGCFVGDARSFRERIPRSLSLLDHRGPDDCGIETFRSTSKEAVIGSTRLAIVDLSEAGHMPMSRADGMQAIVFNGEVYNTESLRETLRARGIHFKSRSDTEILLHGLALDGPAFLDRIDGMYALAFWDARDGGSLLLARDRFGEKPLFVKELADGGVAFGSELRALIDLCGEQPIVDPSVLAHIVTWGYPPPERSIIRDIRKLLPGHWIRYGSHVEGGTLSPLDEGDCLSQVTNCGNAGEALYDALRQSVEERLVADVPVGVFLSGGIDSAAVTALAARSVDGGALNTYTVGYPGSEVSELAAARRVAKHLGTRHHEVILDEDRLSALPFVVASLGEPIGDPAALPTYFLSLAARQTSTVLLTGEGADEVLFGYPRYVLHDLADHADEGQLLARLLSKLPFRPFTRLRDREQAPMERDGTWKGLGPQSYHLGPPAVSNDDVAPLGVQGQVQTRNSARTARADDVYRWMPESVLPRLDRMTMAASIEARAPFLARDVVRFGLHLPDAELRRFPFGKTVLRSALVKEYGWAKAWGMKRAFAVPLIDWLIGPLRPLTEAVFFGDALASRGWFHAESLQAVGTAILQRRQSAARLAWTLITIELWARAYLDGIWPEVPDKGKAASDFPEAVEVGA